MRVLFSAVPGYGLFLSTVPLAWALRAAGHEVLVANTGPAVAGAVEAGLPAVDVCPGQEVWGEFTSLMGGVATGKSVSTNPFGLFGERMADGLVRVAEAFRPDVIVGTIEQGAAPVVSGLLGVPLVEQGIRLARGGQEEWVIRMRTSIAEAMAETADRFGAKSQLPVATIDIRPPSVGGTENDTQWLMRFVPYNGNREIPEWALHSADRPRIGMTLGSVLPALGGAAAARQIIDGLASVEAEIVVAFGDVDRSSLGAIPPNVRPVGWLPLSALLPRCAAAVHHGGAGTALTALYYGIPQLVLPHGADQPANAAVVAERGAGISLPAPFDVAELAPAVRRLLDEPEFARVAREVQREIAEQPSPAAIVGRIEALIG